MTLIEHLISIAEHADLSTGDLEALAEAASAIGAQQAEIAALQLNLRRVWQALPENCGRTAHESAIAAIVDAALNHIQGDGRDA